MPLYETELINIEKEPTKLRSVRKKCPLQELLVQAARMRRKKLMNAYPLALQSLHLGPN